MSIRLTHPLVYSRSFDSCIPFSRSIYSFEAVEKAIKCAVETKEYLQIPQLVVSLKEPYQNSMLFSFLSAFQHHHRIRVIDEILQSFRVLIRFLCLSLSSNALSVQAVFLILMSSLCAVDKLDEAIKVVEEMGGAGCIPDLESYGAVINSLCLARKTSDVVKIVKEMVSKAGISPRKGMLTKLAAALRANREIWKAIEMIEFVESRDYPVEFESYEVVVVEGCLEVREYILAGKMVMRMTDRGFIPYIKVRQKVVERLISIGEWKLACTVRQRLSELRS